MMTLTSQAQRYLEKLDIGYSYRLAKRMEEHCTNPVLGYRTAGSPAEIATGDMLAAEMKENRLFQSMEGRHHRGRVGV